MKKILTISLAVCLLLTMAGCSAAGLERKIDAAEDRMEHRLDVAEDALENAVRQTTEPRKEESRKEEPRTTEPRKEEPRTTEPRKEEPRTTEPRKEEPPKEETHTEAPASAPQPQISREEAEKAALNHVGLAADQVQRLRSDLERDDGIIQYDVEFLEGDWEYEFEIDADTGKILSFDKDYRYD